MNSPLCPAIRYAHAPAAIEFLCAAFGFSRHAVYADTHDAAIIQHAQLTFGPAMIMLGSAREDAARARYGWRTPQEAGGTTMSLYIVVADPDAHCAKAREAGATIIDEPRANDGYPGRGYVARDPEGNVWSFGSYDPWATAPG